MIIHRSPFRLYADPTRVLLRFLNFGHKDRIDPVAAYIDSLSEPEAERQLQGILQDFSHRHTRMEEVFELHYYRLADMVAQDLSPIKKLLLGAYFTHEYSVQAAALFNPSLVQHPDQSGLPEGDTRIIMSLRATGEGHISSLAFMEGLIRADGSMDWDTQKHPLQSGTIIRKPALEDTDYDVSFDKDTPLSGRMLFPHTSVESNGMEDVRFVRFEGESDKKYLGTYTAYNGRAIRPQWIETDDFIHFSVKTMTGQAASDKGMALFPAKIKGKYAMIGRQGGRELSIMYADNRYHWDNYQALQGPSRHWEMLQMGNCGSPVRTPEGWLLLTHAVGAMRKYVLSMSLLDLDDPSKVIASLDEPFMHPNEEEREGYVPNVLYTCGMMVHQDNLVIPYAMSDRAISVAQVDINEVLSTLLKK
jgi:predicted GH43/DUF377 family glycosyl hydrolase